MIFTLIIKRTTRKQISVFVCVQDGGGGGGGKGMQTTQSKSWLCPSLVRFSLVHFSRKTVVVVVVVYF